MHTLRLHSILAAALTLALPAALAAQAPAPADTLKACYAPSTGTVYRIGVPDAPAACTKSTHVAFKWVDAKGALRAGGAAPTAGQVLTFNNGYWQPATPAAPASAGITLPYSGSANTTTNLFTVQQTGSGNAAEFTTGGAGIGVRGRSGMGPGVSGYALATGDQAAGVRAEHANAGGTALEVARGAIRVRGAGRGTNTAAFYATMSDLGATQYEDPYTPCPSGQQCWWATIDHPMLNAKPDVLLFVTPNGLVNAQTQTFIPIRYMVHYDSIHQRWQILANYAQGTSMTTAAFNFLVIRN